MLVAVTDACIFIDLLDLKITDPFFKLDLEVHTSYEVWDELNEDQQEILKGYRSLKKLIVHILEPEDKKNYRAYLIHQDYHRLTLPYYI